jgi:hypothetical protein
MRTMMLVAVLLLVGTSASAQALPAAGTTADCFPSNHIDKVVVQMADGTTRRGSLLCLGAGGLTLAEKQSVGRFRLDEVRQIRKAADPVWDGAAKGAAVSLVLLAFCTSHCPAEVIARTALGYGVFGLVLDAIDTNTQTIYRPSPAKRLALGFHVRF